MGFVTPHQVDHVIEYGTVIPSTSCVKTIGGGLRLFTPRKTSNSILKLFEFKDETVIVRYVDKKDYTLIIDINIQYKWKKEVE